VEHDPTSGAGPSTTGNEHNPIEPTETSALAPDIVDPMRAHNLAATNGETHRVVRGRRLEAWCRRPDPQPAAARSRGL
jgi:hypothetical protein